MDRTQMRLLLSDEATALGSIPLRGTFCLFVLLSFAHGHVISAIMGSLSMMILKKDGQVLSAVCWSQGQEHYLIWQNPMTLVRLCEFGGSIRCNRMPVE